MDNNELIQAVEESINQGWSWTDWSLFIVSVVSPIIMAISAFFAWRATKISKEATQLNLDMFEKQKEDYESSFLPVFKVESVNVSSEVIMLKLYNVNEKSIATTNFATTDFVEHFEKTETKKNLISMKFLGDFKEHDQVKVWIYYTTLNHKRYLSVITFRIVEGKIMIEKHEIKNKTVT